MRITTSAPGKLLLLGEHSVVHGHPCILTSVDKRIEVTVEHIEDPHFYLDAPDVGIHNYQVSFEKLGGDVPKGAQYCEFALKNILKKYKIAKGIKASVKAQFSSELGFGSSSAATVAAIKAISELNNLGLTDREIFDISRATVLDVKGVGSGADLAAAVYGGTIFYAKTGGVIRQIVHAEMPMVVGYTGQKAITADTINQVGTLKQKYPNEIENIFDCISNLVGKAEMLIQNEDWVDLGQLMNFNQGYLDALGVNSRVLSDLIFAARGSGAYGAKLSGGGVGDCMIALCDPNQKSKIEESIKSVGGEVVQVRCGVDGVRVEDRNQKIES